MRIDSKYQDLENELRAERERRLAAERRAAVLEEAAKRAYQLAAWGGPRVRTNDTPQS
jgi:hypothetical protein